MYAVVTTGGKQYIVEPGDNLKVEKVSGDPGTTLDIAPVLALGGPDGIKLGTPYLDDVQVKATVVRTARDRKIVVFKKKRRQGYHKKQGHRQWYSLLRIDEISTGAADAVSEEPVAQAIPVPEQTAQVVEQTQAPAEATVAGAAESRQE